MDCPIRGMETVVVTVSGYHGLERFNLIRLISQAGASYVGGMSKSITHLVCWKFEGRKYDLAKKFKTIIVNHQWVEDCIKQGKRIPEHPYMLQSGKQVGPLSMEAPFINKVGPLNKNSEALLDKSNTYEDSEGRIDCMGHNRDSGLASGTGSFLLNENLFHEMKKENITANKSKSKQGTKTSKRECRSTGSYCFCDPPLSALLGLKHENSSSKSSMHSAKEKRKISGDDKPSTCATKHLVKGKRKISNHIGSTSFAEPFCNMQSLVESNFTRNNVEIVLLDSDQQFQPIELHNHNSDVAASSEYEGCQQKVNISETGRISPAASNNDGAFTYEAFDDIVEKRDATYLTAFKDSNRCPEETLNALETPPPAIVHLLGDKNKDAHQSEPVTRLPTTEELSCVICWTEFSSTRGVLPCGHRFCYSCIQNWADHMISSRKNSTCPLCKVNFVSITKVEDAASFDQKIYSQTIPCANSTTEIFILNDQERQRAGAESSLSTVCVECQCREPEDLLIKCDHCNIQCIHIYCLDPPLLPWTCIHCKDLQRLLYQAR